MFSVGHRLLPIRFSRIFQAIFICTLWLLATDAVAAPIAISANNFQRISIPRKFKAQTLGRALGCYLRSQDGSVSFGWFKRGDEKDKRISLQILKRGDLVKARNIARQALRSAQNSTSSARHSLENRLSFAGFLLAVFDACTLASFSGEPGTATPTATPVESPSPAPSPVPTVSPTASITPSTNPTSTPSSNPSGGSGNPSISITRGEITWVIRRPLSAGPGTVTQGNFVNGDPWVVGPVELLSISPGSSITAEGYTINGSMINPTYWASQPGGVAAAQGYDGRSSEGNPVGTIAYLPRYSAAADVARSLPRLLSANTSLISAKGRTDFSNADVKTALQAASVLTVLSTTAPSGAFRPPYAGTDKSLRFFESQLQWNQLQQLPLVAGAPSATQLASGFTNVWLDWTGWSSRMLHPIANMPEYGRDLSSLIGEAGVLVNMNISQSEKRPLVIALVQMGIDFYGNLLNGARWGGTGGQCSGRKFPILFAGAMLQDTDMLQVGYAYPSYRTIVNGQVQVSSVFGEDSQTFRVEETAPGQVNFQGSTILPQYYSSAHLSLPEFGFSHTDYPSNDNRFWDGDPYRRCCTANAWVGTLLATRLMGLKANWNNNNLFDYQDRYMNVQLERIIASPSTDQHWHRSWSTWVESAWDTYRSGLGGVWQCNLAANVCRGQ